MVGHDQVFLHIVQFIKSDLNSTLNYCSKFIACYGIAFKSKQPKDFIFEILEKIHEGKRKCYLKNYKTFRNSVYYHLRNQMLNFVNAAKKNENVIDIYSKLIDKNDGSSRTFIETYAHIVKEEIPRYVEKNDLNEKLFSLFDSFKEKTEIVILNKILHGKSNQEIAPDINCSVSFIENAKKRIYNRIQKRIDKDLLKEVVDYKLLKRTRVKAKVEVEKKSNP